MSSQPSCLSICQEFLKIFDIFYKYDKSIIVTDLNDDTLEEMLRLQEEKYAHIETREGKTVITPLKIEIKRFKHTSIEGFLVPKLHEIASKHNIEYPKVIVDNFGKIESITFEATLNEKMLREIRNYVELSFSRVATEVAEQKLKEQIDNLVLIVSIGVFFAPLAIAATFYVFLFSNLLFLLLISIVSIIAIHLTLTNLLKLKEKLKERDILLEQLRQRLP